MHQTISMEGNRITIKTTDDRVHVLVANSTSITTTRKSKWIEIKWNVKYNFIKLHNLADEKLQKILACRVTGTGGQAKSLPMLDRALNRLAFR